MGHRVLTLSRTVVCFPQIEDLLQNCKWLRQLFCVCWFHHIYINLQMGEVFIDCLQFVITYHQTWSFRCSWSIACRRFSSWVFILDLLPGFNGLGKDNYKTRREKVQLGELVLLISDVWRHVLYPIQCALYAHWCMNPCPWHVIRCQYTPVKMTPCYLTIIWYIWYLIYQIIESDIVWHTMNTVKLNLVHIFSYRLRCFPRI